MLSVVPGTCRILWSDNFTEFVTDWTKRDYFLVTLGLFEASAFFEEASKVMKIGLSLIHNYHSLDRLIKLVQIHDTHYRSDVKQWFSTVSCQ
jgi:hypothetical protein